MGYTVTWFRAVADNALTARRQFTTMKCHALSQCSSIIYQSVTLWSLDRVWKARPLASVSTRIHSLHFLLSGSVKDHECNVHHGTSNCTSFLTRICNIPVGKNCAFPNPTQPKAKRLWPRQVHWLLEGFQPLIQGFNLSILNSRSFTSGSLSHVSSCGLAVLIRRRY
jgi:hypothetical protein